MGQFLSVLTSLWLSWLSPSYTDYNIEKHIYKEDIQIFFIINGILTESMKRIRRVVLRQKWSELNYNYAD